MRDDIKDIIDEELKEKEVNLEDMYEPMQDDINKLVDEQNKKMRELEEEHQKGLDEISSKYSLSGEELVKMQEKAMQDAMKYLNREDN